MTEAMLYDRIDEGKVHCRLCAHGCTIDKGRRGVCGVRQNIRGRLESLVYGRIVARDVDPIEKKPLFHFDPGSRAYSIATVGCNFTCANCQNHYISQYPSEHAGRILGDAATSTEIVCDALDSGCHSIAYTYSEPTIAFEFVLETMRAAQAAGLSNVWVSNGYFSHDAFDELRPWLDAINVDLKSISDATYHALCGAGVRPVIASIERLVAAGIWTEVTTLVIPGVNDSREELRWIAEAIVGISPEIPWHISRFFPAHRLVDRGPTPIGTLEAACRIGRGVGLQHVYIGNVPGEGKTTHCAACGEAVIRRSGFRVRENRLNEGRCPACQMPVAGVWSRQLPDAV